MRKRKHISISMKLAACLDALGLTGEKIHWDHTVALSARIYHPDTGLYEPDELDPRYIRPMRIEDHKIKTFGRGATTAGSDIGIAAKLKRIEKDPAGGEEFRRKLLAKPPREDRPKSKWPKRPMNSKRRTK